VLEKEYSNADQDIVQASQTKSKTSMRDHINLESLLGLKVGVYSAILTFRKDISWDKNSPFCCKLLQPCRRVSVNERKVNEKLACLFMCSLESEVEDTVMFER
jgi:hypothetical protein